MGSGIFSIGNMNPLNITVGRNIPIREMNMADCWEAVEEEISNPSDSATRINRILSAKSNGKLPLIGTSNTKTLKSKMLAIFKMESSK